MHIRDLVRQCDALLHPENYHDYAPNGLQVMGSEEVTRVVTGVTACLELIDRAAELNAQAILVHHGWFWKREDPRIVGVKGARVRRLIESGINLVAYHLPLDDQPDFGNNALIGKALGFECTGSFGEDNLGRLGTTPDITVPEQIGRAHV